MSLNELTFQGGAPLLKEDTCTREDVACYLRAAGIDLDRLQQDALLSNLPQGTNICSDGLPPNIDPTPRRGAGRLLVRPTVSELDAAIRSGDDLAVIAEKDRMEGVFHQLSDYHRQLWESHGDLALVWARDNDPTRTGGGGHFHKLSEPRWLVFIDVTERWCDDRSLQEKIIEDGYVHHLGCNKASPYLTQLEADDH